MNRMENIKKLLREVYGIDANIGDVFFGTKPATDEEVAAEIARVMNAPEDWEEFFIDEDNATS